MNICKGDNLILSHLGISPEMFKEGSGDHIFLIDIGDGWREEKTELCNLTSIEARRHWFTKSVTHKTDGRLNFLNLIEGQEAIIESPTNEFEPHIISYDETYIIPGSVSEYIVSSYGASEGDEIATIKTYIRD